MKNKFRTLIVFSKMEFKRAMRDRFALFFTFSFPLIFLVIFGTLLGNNIQWNFRIGIVNKSNSEVAKNFVKDAETFKLYKYDKSITSLEGAQKKLIRGEIDAVIVLREDFGKNIKDNKNNKATGNAYVYYGNNGAEVGSILVKIMQAKFDSLNFAVTGVELPYTAVPVKEGIKGLQKFDYTFSGLVGFTMLAQGIFTTVILFPNLKKQGVLKRFHVTPLRPWQYFGANIIAQSVIGLLSITLQFIVATLFFGIRLQGNIFALLVFLIISIITIYGIGLAIGGWAESEQQAAPLGNIIVFPMIMMCGTFFPRFQMPELFQKISQYMPLTPIIDGTRFIMTENIGLGEVLPQLKLIGLWLVVIYVVAFRVFRWE